ncbi:MAG: hypothetical protein SGBAC_010787 [Bacillariaceae sp.]
MASVSSSKKVADFLCSDASEVRLSSSAGTVKPGPASFASFASPSTLAFNSSATTNNTLRASPVSPEPDSMSTDVIPLHRKTAKSKTTTRQEPYILPGPAAPIGSSFNSMNMLVHASLAHLLNPSRPQDPPHQHQHQHQQPQHHHPHHQPVQPPTKKKVGRPKKDKSAATKERKPKPKLAKKSSSNKPKGVKYCNKQIDKWKIRYEEAKEYAKTNGHCMIPNEYPENPLLGGWAKRQRYQYQVLKKGETNKIHPNGSRNSSISLERINLLEDIGFCWQHKDHKWHARYAELVKFVKEYGHAAVPTTYDDNQGLAGWVKVQRRQYKLFALHKKSSMTPARIKLLNKVDFCWSIKETAQLPPGLVDKLITSNNSNNNSNSNTNTTNNNNNNTTNNNNNNNNNTNDNDNDYDNDNKNNVAMNGAEGTYNKSSSSSSSSSKSASDALVCLKVNETTTIPSQRTKRQEPNGENSMEEAKPATDLWTSSLKGEAPTKVEAMEEDIKEEDAISALLSFAR